ncbi:hypothetical protein BJY59DRAFT_688366 [Rhodotorula toruloides]
MSNEAYGIRCSEHNGVRALPRCKTSASLDRPYIDAGRRPRHLTATSTLSSVGSSASSSSDSRSRRPSSRNRATTRSRSRTHLRKVAAELSQPRNAPLAQPSVLTRPWESASRPSSRFATRTERTSAASTSSCSRREGSLRLLLAATTPSSTRRSLAGWTRRRRRAYRSCTSLTWRESGRTDEGNAEQKPSYPAAPSNPHESQVKY